MTLRTRFLGAALATAAAALLVVLVLAGPSLRRGAVESTRERLLAETRLAARLVAEPLSLGAGSGALDRLANALADATGARVTLIAPDGRVLADSSLTRPQVERLENHGNRPEVRQALAEGEAAALRHSNTFEREQLYAAVLVRSQGRPVGVARLSQRLALVEQQADSLERALGLALLAAFAITVLLTVIVSASVVGPLREIMHAARVFASGELGARAPAGRSDELGELARILNHSAATLEQRLNDNARERARTEAILAAMEDGVLALDHRGHVLLANDTLRRALDLREPLGRHYLEAIRQREVGAVIEAVLRTGRRQADEVEIPHLHRVFALTGVAFPDAPGTPHGAVITFHDITGRRRLERIRRDFVANASHELRTPLTSIRGFVEALEDGAIADPATAQRFLGKIRTHADRMAALVEDLLELSRLESGERPPVWEHVTPAEVAGEVVVSLASLAAQRGVALSHVDQGAPPLVSDGDRLRRILEALVENAVKYTAAQHPQGGGAVEIRTSAAASGGARVEVVDNGPGIGREHLTRIFERFYRVDKARSRELGGTGLGLSIVKHLAEGMGASVGVESELGRGSRFFVSVPLRPAPGADTSGAAGAEGEAPTR